MIITEAVKNLSKELLEARLKTNPFDKTAVEIELSHYAFTQFVKENFVAEENRFSIDHFLKLGAYYHVFDKELHAYIKERFKSQPDFEEHLINSIINYQSQENERIRNQICSKE